MMNLKVIILYEKIVTGNVFVHYLQTFIFFKIKKLNIFLVAEIGD